IVLLLDVTKGLAAVLVARALTGNDAVQMFAGLTSVAGHNWPLFFKFRGGRGVATTIGVFIGIAPLVILIATTIGVALIAITRFVSLGSMVGAIAIPVFMIIFRMPPIYIAFGTLMALMAVWRHRQNISRLLKGTESKLGTKVNMGNEEKRGK
ncbi:MAG: glycerol-3-phosphate acyltransferase, partial [Firmicutes bacterium]|nr:glycerol-3-phosphate acyltransferase [Bacillota bacterium]